MEIYDKPLDSLCRACKSDLNEYRYSLFASDNLCELFASFTSLNIYRNDGQPSAVCSMCYQLMTSFYRFRAMCLNSYAKFQEILDARVKTEIPEIQNNALPEDIVKVKIEVPDSVVCEPMADQSNSEELEIKEEKVQENYWYSNNDEDEISMDADQDDEDYDEEHDGNLEGTSKGNEMYSCHLCEKKFFKKRRYEGHLREHEGLKNNIISHQLQIRPSFKRSIVWNFFMKTNKTVVCTICKKGLKFSGNTSNLNDHLRRRHPGYLNDKNGGNIPIVNSVASTADMSPVTQSFIDDAVNQFNQSQIPDASTKTQPAGSSTMSTPTTSSTNTLSALGLLTARSSPESATGIRRLGPPSIVKPRKILQPKMFLSDKRTDLPDPEKQSIDYSLIKMIVIDFQLPSIVENIGFLEYSYKLQPLYKVPNRKLMSHKILPTKYQEIKQKVHAMLKEVSYIAVTTEMWTSDNNRSFLALTSHFIFDSKLKSAVLSAKEIPENYTADNIAKAVSSILEEWSISPKVVTVVSDNGANIKKAIENLKIHHHPCVAHTLNQCVTDAIKQVPEFTALFTTCRSLVAYFKQNTAASEYLNKMQRQMCLPELKVKQDFAARWNSSLIMLERLLTLKQPLSAVITSLPNAPKFPNSLEWDIIHDYIHVLRPVELMIKELSAEKYITMSSIIPLIRGLQSTVKIETTLTPCGRHLKIALLDILSTRLAILETDKSYAKATFLDARFKKIAFCIEANGNNAQKLITEEISYDISHNLRLTAANVSEERVTNNESQPTAVSLWSVLDQEVANANAAISSVPSVTANLLVEQYLRMEYLDRSQNPLEFWKRNEKSLPELFQLSQKYLCIPASSVPADRVFSMAGEIINERRNRLEGEKLNQIIFLNSNLEL